MMKAPSVIVLAATFIGGFASFAAAPIAAQENRDPHWPCVQPKVPELSVTAVWAGPAIDEAGKDWQQDREVAEMAAAVASRRVPVEEAVANVAKFAEGLKPDEKAAKLTRLFAGIFASLDHERSEVMEGIGRYARGQEAMAEQIRQDQSRLSDMRSSNGDPQQVSALTTQLQTQVRVFNDRAHSLTYVCEVPTLIEQRLGTLARAIQGEIPD